MSGVALLALLGTRVEVLLAFLGVGALDMQRLTRVGVRVAAAGMSPGGLPFWRRSLLRLRYQKSRGGFLRLCRVMSLRMSLPLHRNPNPLCTGQLSQGSLHGHSHSLALG